MNAALEDYRVDLDYYSGPLDLLLFLVKKHEIDLHDIPIAKLTEQYMQYLEQMKEFDINVAAEFLVMAATLLEIKAAMIAPRGEEIAEGEEGDDATDAISDVDPRFELVQQLLEYKRFKDAANELEDRLYEWENRFAHKPAKLPKEKTAGGDGGEDGDEAEPIELDLDDISINDLCEAFARILESVGQGKNIHAVTYDDTPVELHAADIADRLQREGPLRLQDFFVGRRTRGEMIGLFLAMLELVREKRVQIQQDRPGGDIALSLRPEQEQLHESDDQATDWTDPETGEMQYEWPDEEAKAAAEARAERRKKFVANRFKKEEEREDLGEEEDYIKLDTVSLEDELEATELETADDTNDETGVEARIETVDEVEDLTGASNEEMEKT